MPSRRSTSRLVRCGEPSSRSRGAVCSSIKPLPLRLPCVRPVLSSCTPVHSVRRTATCATARQIRAAPVCSLRACCPVFLTSYSRERTRGSHIDGDGGDGLVPPGRLCGDRPPSVSLLSTLRWGERSISGGRFRSAVLVAAVLHFRCTSDRLRGHAAAGPSARISALRQTLAEPRLCYTGCSAHGFYTPGAPCRARPALLRATPFSPAAHRRRYALRRP
jgi:hypothetical protein